MYLNVSEINEWNLLRGVAEVTPGLEGPQLVSLYQF